MSQNINRVVVSGNLTRDPELRTTGGGSSVCSMRVAVNGRRKDASGNWADDPNYFDVTVFGNQGENCATYLAKGRGLIVDGRLDWREWETQDGGKRQAVQIIADRVQFLGGGDRQESAPVSEVPADMSDFDDRPAPVTGPQDDIPF